jgi:S-(hydroxymethyl)glutathione dehydrogenase/alcohol dehydrogenase
MLADGGRLVAVGIADGDATAGIPITRLVRRSQRIIGSYGARTRTDLPRVIDMTARGAIQPQQVVTRRYALQDAARAYEDLNQGAIIGRAVVCM